jgi:capsular exopolysaccharide synthesis family protein
MADNTVRFIDSLVSSIDSTLQAAGNEYTDFRTRNRVVDIGKESSLIIEKSRNIEEQEAIAKIKLDYYNNLKNYLKSPDKIKNLVAPSVVGVTDPTLNSLVLKLSELSNQREVQSYTLQERNPKLIGLDKEITYTQNELAENINNLSTNTQLELNNLTRQKNEVYQQQSTLPKKEQNYISIKRNFDLNNDLYNFLLQRRAEAGIMKASNEPQAQILDPARIDTSKIIGHYGVINLIIGAILGLALAFLFFLIKNYSDKTIHDVAEVNEVLDLPVSGMIKHNKSTSILPAYEFPDSEIAESFRDLRLKLYFSANGTQVGKVVSVNSNTSEEGKSFVSSNLASILAVDNKSVLLIDSDLRKPDIQNAFRVSNQTGLSSYLKNEADFDTVLTKSNVQNLTLITTGPATDHPSELLNNGRLKILLEEARNRFDFIVIKNPPSGLISDALLIQKLADMNIYLLKFKYSTTRHIQYINDLAKLGMLNNMMVVLNNVGHSNGQSYGYYK